MYSEATRDVPKIKKWASELGWILEAEIKARTGSLYLRFVHPKTSHFLFIRFSNHPPGRPFKLSLHPGSNITADTVLYLLVRKAGGKFYK